MSIGGTGKEKLVFYIYNASAETDLAYAFQMSDTTIFTCPFEDVPLYIKTIYEASSKFVKLEHAAAVWRLRIGK